MGRFAMRLLACVLVLAATGTASACINDSEVDRSEREFKSSYNERSPRGEPAPEYSPGGEPTGPLAFLGLGSALLAGACAMSLLRPGRSA